MTLTNNKPFIAGNWKMYKTGPEAVALAHTITTSLPAPIEVEVVVIPTYTSLQSVYTQIEDSTVKLGAQNMYWEEQGAFTGEISGPMLKAVGCDYVVIGHSERRQYFGETNTTVNKKVKSALAQGLIPIMCLGESLEEREQEQTVTKVKSQLAEGLAGVSEDDMPRLVLAYEPIWAIGTGLTATPEQAQEVHAFIRAWLTETYGNGISSCAIILYGGSVKPANTFSLLKEQDINGALVGGAALKSESFIEIVKEAIKAYKEK